MWWNPFVYSRRKTVQVKVGNVTIGSDNPVRLQSMNNTNTNDTDACVKQIERIADAGGDIVRLTTQGSKEAENMNAIETQVRADGYSVPLVADVHFNPAVAEVAARYVEKVRINPGNYCNAGLDATEEKLRHLIDLCKQRGVALRIGVNHGSLSKRIMDTYGDTEEGMVEEAMEYLRICKKLNFDQVVVSMKSSNVKVMVHSMRKLAVAMEKEGMQFPLHIGVTEAGNGEDGRVKSAVGIGALLADGLGDTIRVSLSEDPEYEIPVAAKIRNYIQGFAAAPAQDAPAGQIDQMTFCRRATRAVGNVGGEHVPVVMGGQEKDLHAEGANLITAYTQDLNETLIRQLSEDKQTILVLQTTSANPVADFRAAFARLMAAGCDVPVILRRDYEDNNLESLQVKAAIDLGALFLDGLGDGIWIVDRAMENKAVESLMFGILQATRSRISRTEYISCPGCGRTLYDLQGTIARIKEATKDLKGVKIGIMGCIVNGPGEMADADFGYVGAGPGRVSLYKGKECVEKNIPEAEAVTKLVELIQK